MRDQFYGDRKDLWKWTVVLDEAGDREIFYIGMYRPDQEKSDRRGINEAVHKFFQQEIKILNAEKKCSRFNNYHRASCAF